MNLSTSQSRPGAAEPLGPKIRRQRLRLGLTLEELAGRTSISKPYLSLIETGRVVNPPSDEKLCRLEQTLGFTVGELLTQAHLQRTPRDVRAVLHRLMAAEERLAVDAQNAAAKGETAKADKAKGGEAPSPSSAPNSQSATPNPQAASCSDPAYLSSVLRKMATPAMQKQMANAVPLINGASADYPRDFSDLGYPSRVAREYIACPDITDRDAFAVRVYGDSMTPKYRAGDIVIFSPALSARDGDDCFIRFADGRTTFKRIFFENGEDNRPVLRLQPRNERHRAQSVRSEEVVGLHKAVYRYQRVDED